MANPPINRRERVSKKTKENRERKRAFVAVLAKFLAGRQAEKSVALELGNEWAEQWAELRAASPLFGYVGVEEATAILETWLLRR